MSLISPAMVLTPIPFYHQAEHSGKYHQSRDMVKRLECVLMFPTECLWVTLMPEHTGSQEQALIFPHWSLQGAIGPISLNRSSMGGEARTQAYWALPAHQRAVAHSYPSGLRNRDSRAWGVGSKPLEMTTVQRPRLYK